MYEHTLRPSYQLALAIVIFAPSGKVAEQVAVPEASVSVTALQVID